MNIHRYYKLSLLRPIIQPSLVPTSRLKTRLISNTGIKSRTLSTMATATKIHLSPTADSGIYSSNVREDSARTASEILQEDMAKHHVFFNDSGFHSMLSTSIRRTGRQGLCLPSTDHIPHHILSIYALGATPEQIRAAYQGNIGYQRPVRPTDQEVVLSMRDKVKFKEYLGKEKHYPNYLAFFQQELDTKGTGDVLKEYVFAGDERAEDMLCRVFGGE